MVVCLVGTILKISLFTSRPWHAITHIFSPPLKPPPQGSEQRKPQKGDEHGWRRKICTALIRAGGDRFSIQQLQFLMPNTARMVRMWSRVRRVKLKTEVVHVLTNHTNTNHNANISTTTPHLPGMDLDLDLDLSAPCPAPAVHWIGGSPGENGLQDHERVLLYVHGTCTAYATPFFFSFSFFV